MTHKWVYDKESFYDFLGLVIEYAPQFPEEDFLEPHEQLDLDKAFKELAIGLDALNVQISQSLRHDCQVLFAQAFACFQNNDEFGGSKLLQEVDKLLFKDHVADK